MYPFELPLSSTKYDQDIAWWDEGWSYDEIQNVIELGDSLPKNEAMIGGKKEVDNELKDIRESTVSWIGPSEQSNWIYQRLQHQIRIINKEYFGFDLLGFEDRLQYTTYDYKEDSPRGGDHYGWHVDIMGSGDRGCRKLSFSLLLSDPKDYDGGELVVNGYRYISIPKVRGKLIVFPSYTLHKVCPVTRGTRKALVGWVSGPQFR
jgi:PKHD-type hydroxylase